MNLATVSTKRWGPTWTANTATGNRKRHTGADVEPFYVSYLLLNLHFHLLVQTHLKQLLIHWPFHNYIMVMSVISRPSSMKNKHVMCAVWVWGLPASFLTSHLAFTSRADLWWFTGSWLMQNKKKATGGAFQKTEPKSKQNQMLR